jgi:hypothetical protein
MKLREAKEFARRFIPVRMLTLHDEEIKASKGKSSSISYGITDFVYFVNEGLLAKIIIILEGEGSHKFRYYVGYKFSEPNVIKFYIAEDENRDIFNVLYTEGMKWDGKVEVTPDQLEKWSKQYARHLKDLEEANTEHKGSIEE